MVKTICEKIMTKEITSVELKSVLGRELYIYSQEGWTDVLNEFSFSYTAEQFCQYISDYKTWAELNNVYVEITEGKAEFRQSINEAKDLLKDWLENNELDDFKSLYSGLSARQKEAVVLVLRYSEIFEYAYANLMCPSTNELSLLWKGNKKLKKCLFVPIKGPDYELTVNMFTGEVVDYVDMDIIEGNF